MPDKRLIDANALLKHRVFRGPQVPGYRTAVENAPTIDAVEVVRCRECEKFWEYTESHKATVEKADGDCTIRCMVAPDNPQFCAVQKDDYCSMGKRNGAKMDGGAER